MVKKEKVIFLIEKIDIKKKELKQLNQELRKAFNAISNMWKEESAKQFPKLPPCDIEEYVGVDITIKDVVYNIFISEHNQKLFCMFSLDRKNKEYSSLSIKKTIDDADFERFKFFINNYLSKNNKEICFVGDGYLIEFKKEQYDEVFQLYLDLVRTFVG